MTRRLPFQQLLHWSVGEGTTPFPGLLPFTLDLYLVMLSAKLGGIKYHFWVFGMTRSGIELRLTGLLTNTLLIWQMGTDPQVYHRILKCFRIIEKTFFLIFREVRPNISYPSCWPVAIIQSKKTGLWYTTIWTKNINFMTLNKFYPQSNSEQTRK